MFLHDGTWQGTRIVSTDWVETATQKHVTIPHGRFDYGYNWFPGTKVIAGARPNYVASFGYGGQTMFLVPELDLIVAMTCDLTDAGGNGRVLIDAIFEAIKP